MLFYKFSIIVKIRKKKKLSKNYRFGFRSVYFIMLIQDELNSATTPQYDTCNDTATTPQYDIHKCTASRP
jgi:hypothetical protein